MVSVGSTFRVMVFPVNVLTKICIPSLNVTQDVMLTLSKYCYHSKRDYLQAVCQYQTQLILPDAFLS